MKKLKRIVLFLMLVLTITLPSTSAQAKLRLNKNGINLKIGKTCKLKVKGMKKKKKVKWSSDNKKIATVNKKGIVKAKRPGVTKIWAKIGKTKLYCFVGVPEEPINPVRPQPVPEQIPQDDIGLIE